MYLKKLNCYNEKPQDLYGLNIVDVPCCVRLCSLQLSLRSSKVLLAGGLPCEAHSSHSAKAPGSGPPAADPATCRARRGRKSPGQVDGVGWGGT